MITLYPYQNKIITDLQSQFKSGAKSLIMQLATGGGKTIIFSYMTKKHIDKSPYNKVLILTDRKELLNQAGNTLNKFDISPSFINAQNKELDFFKQVHVGMVETLSRRCNKLKDLINSFTLVIIDEAHKGNFKKLFPLLNKSAFVIGATATPVSSKNNNLIELYNSLVTGTPINELIKLNRLCSYQHLAPKVNLSQKIKVTSGEYNNADLFKAYDKGELYKGVIKFYKKYALDSKTLVFCVNIEHTRKTAEEFRAQGFNNVRFITSKDSKETREDVLNWFKNTKKAILVNCGILTTGFDEPTIETIILNRKTLSLALYLQMIGRGGRKLPNKNSFKVIDLGENYKSFGLWDEEKNWQKLWNYEPRKKKGEGVAAVKECVSCESLIAASAKKCQFCGAIQPVKKKELQEAEELQEIKPIQRPHEIPLSLRLKEPQHMTAVELEKRRLLGNNGKAYKMGWVVFQIKKSKNAKEKLKQYANLKGYSEKWVFRQLNY